MKIAVNTRLLLAGKLEGIGWYAAEVLQRLVRRFPQHEFHFFFDRKPDPAFRFGPNVYFHVLAPPARHPILWHLWFQGSLRLAISRHNFDVYYSPEMFMPLGLSIPSVITIHDIGYLHFEENLNGLAGRYYRYFVKKFAKQSDHIITVSAYSREDIAKQLHLSLSKISVSYNGCRSIFRPLSTAERKAARARFANGQPYFCYIGSIHPRKNVLRQIQAFEKMIYQTNAPHHLVLGGRMAWNSEEVRSWLAHSKIKDRIRHTGYLSEQDLAALLGGSEGLLYVSHFEGFGVPLLEAMHAEVPMVTAPQASMPEVAGEAALYAPSTSMDAIAHALTELYQSPDLTRQLIEAGRKQRTQFHWERVSDVVATVLRL